jgi:hypothetical protein
MSLFGVETESPVTQGIKWSEWYPPKRRCFSAKLRDAKFQKTIIFVIISTFALLRLFLHLWLQRCVSAPFCVCAESEHVDTGSVRKRPAWHICKIILADPASKFLPSATF